MILCAMLECCYQWGYHMRVKIPDSNYMEVKRFRKLCWSSAFCGHLLFFKLDMLAPSVRADKGLTEVYLCF